MLINEMNFNLSRSSYSRETVLLFNLIASLFYIYCTHRCIRALFNVEYLYRIHRCIYLVFYSFRLMFTIFNVQRRFVISEAQCKNMISPGKLWFEHCQPYRYQNPSSSICHCVQFGKARNNFEKFREESRISHKTKISRVYFIFLAHLVQKFNNETLLYWCYTVIFIIQTRGS